MGTGRAITTRPRLDNPSKTSIRSHGGQASLPAFFGIRLTGDTGSAPEASTVRPIQHTPQAQRRGDDQRRLADGLSYGQRRAIVSRPTPAEIERRNAAMRAAAAAADRRDSTPAPDLGEWDRALLYGCVETACALND